MTDGNWKEKREKSFLWNALVVASAILTLTIAIITVRKGCNKGDDNNKGIVREEPSPILDEPLPLHDEKPFTLEGRIEDKETGDAIFEAKVFFSGEDHHYTDSDGNFELNIKPPIKVDSETLIIEKEGYERKKMDIRKIKHSTFEDLGVIKLRADEESIVINPLVREEKRESKSFSLIVNNEIVREGSLYNCIKRKIKSGDVFIDYDSMKKNELEYSFNGGEVIFEKRNAKKNEFSLNAISNKYLTKEEIINHLCSKFSGL